MGGVLGGPQGQATEHKRGRLAAVAVRMRPKHLEEIRQLQA